MEDHKSEKKNVDKNDSVEIEQKEENEIAKEVQTSAITELEGIYRRQQELLDLTTFDKVKIKNKYAKVLPSNSTQAVASTSGGVGPHRPLKSSLKKPGTTATGTKKEPKKVRFAEVLEEYETTTQRADYIYNEYTIEEEESELVWENPKEKKVLVIGDIGSGKTSFIKRFVKDFYIDMYRKTLNIYYATKTIYVEDAGSINVHMWDLTAQEHYGYVTQAFYRNSQGAFILYDMTNPKSLNNVRNWKNDLDKNIRLSDGSPLPVMLLATKCDLISEEIESDEKLISICNELGMFSYCRVSSRLDLNVNLAVKVLISEILINEKRIARLNQYKIDLDNMEEIFDIIRLTDDEYNNKNQINNQNSKCYC